jgi:hypothetical protein
MFTVLQIGPYANKVRMPAFAEGVRAYGGQVIEVRDDATGTRLIEALNLIEQRTGRPWFAFTAGMQPREAAARGVLRACGIPLVVLDLGYLRRAGNAKDEAGYYQMGIGRIGWVPQLAPEQMDIARDRLDRLAVTVAPSVAPESRPAAVLVLGQKPGDSQHGLDAIGLEAWLTERAAEYLALGWEVLFRPHPLCPGMKLAVPCTILPSGKEAPIEPQFARVREVVTYNSTAGVEALVAGLRVNCHDSAHYAHLRGPHDRDAVLAHLRALACAQWTLNELRSGEALHFLARSLPVLPVRQARGPIPAPAASAVAHARPAISEVCPLNLPLASGL